MRRVRDLVRGLRWREPRLLRPARRRKLLGLGQVLILGLDVGSREIGLALLDVPDGATAAVVRTKAVWLARAKLEIEPTLALLTSLAGTVDLVAIEPPGGVHPGVLRARGAAAAMGIAQHANLGAKLAGRARGHAEALGMRVVEIPATEWRLGLVGRANASDAVIERALRHRITWTGRSNADERDGAGVALWAAVKQCRHGRLTG